MIHQIENEFLSVQVNEEGAQLWSVKSKKTGVEYLWQGDKAYWGGRAYNLFPFIGRMPEMIYTYDGKTYPLRTHGLARYFPFALESKTEIELVFSFTDNEETKKEYPFSFLFRVFFILDGASLITRYGVTNTDEREMLCALGGHPGINIPFGKGAFEDYYLDFEKQTPVVRQLFDESDRYAAGKAVPYDLVDGTKLPLRHDLFDHDAIVLENTAGVVHIRCDKEERYVTMQYEEYPYIGFWHMTKMDAPYVCLEPWSAMPGLAGKTVALEEKSDLTRVPSKASKSISFTLEIHE